MACRRIAVIYAELILNASQPDELVEISQSRSLPARYLFRAKLILKLAEGALKRLAFLADSIGGTLAQCDPFAIPSTSHWTAAAITE